MFALNPKFLDRSDLVMVDVLDALMTKWFYPPLTIGKIVDIIWVGYGTYFNPGMVDISPASLLDIVKLWDSIQTIQYLTLE